MESNFGKNRGSIPVIESLATLAYDGRRQSFAEEQLIGALRILQSGDVDPRHMTGSWAGAMGHTQFIPTSYLSYAVDFGGDGHRDVWSDDPTDALASTANYLARSGWTRGQPWGMEVRVPAGFNYGSADAANVHPTADWSARGVTRLNGAPLPEHGPMAIIAPAGARGPAFAVYHNFAVIKRYNNATAYAMGVGHLGDRIAGAGPIQGSWPRGDRELSRSEKIELQQKLIARGYATGEPDGVVGPDTTTAIRAYQRSVGMVPDGYASAELLQRLR
jgi:membrane-bound lytic murein transglycosylase B